MRARYYNGDIRRFLNRDTKSGTAAESQSLNRYAYVGGKSGNEGRSERAQSGNSKRNGQFMYAVDTYGNIIIGSRAGQHMPHPALAGGSNPTVQGAGIVETRGGIYKVDNAKGHFKPVPDPKFNFGQKAIITDIMWHVSNHKHYYFISIGGKKLPNL